MSWVPRSCTLPTVERPPRGVEWDALLATAVAAAERLGPTHLRVHLPGDADTATAARDLAGRETRCCSFFSFTLRSSPTGTDLEIRVPPARTTVLDAVQQHAEAARTGVVA